MHKKILLVLLATAILVDFTGCVSMSAQARRQRAYRHYVQKQMKQRQRAVARAQKAANRQFKQKMKSAVVSDPIVTSSVEMAPEFRSEPVAAPSESFSEPVAPPVTVSASDSIAPGTPDQPSPP